MKSFHKELWLDIPHRMEFINITQDVEETIYENGGVIGLYSRFKDQGFAELVKQAVVKTEQKTSCGSSLGCSNKNLDW